MRTRNAFTKKANDKGYSLVELSALFGVSVRHMANIAKNPKRRDLMSLESLPHKGEK